MGTKSKRGAAVALLFWVATSAVAADADAVIERARKAMGDFGDVAAIESSGTLAAGGMAGELTAIEDVRTGRSVVRYTLGPVKGADGFDGKASWSQSPGGEVVVADGAEALADAQTDAWIARRGFLDADSATYGAAERKQHEGRDYDVVRATPANGSAVDLWFAADSGLLTRTTRQQGRDLETTTLGDYREVGGVQLPHAVTSDTGDARNRTVIAWTKVALAPAVADSAFAAPTAPDTVRFTDGSQSATLPVELANNHLYIDATIDGQRVKLLVDTGGANVLTPAAAKRLGLASEGKLVARGVGEKDVDLGLANAKSLTMGTIDVRDPVFYVIDLGALPDVEGFELDGLVGYEVFHRFAVTIDYPAKRLTLARPDAFVAPKGAVAVPFELDANIPIVQGEIDGVPARFSIDTGSRASLSTHSPFTRERKLVEKYRPKFDAVTGWGVGGGLVSKPVRFGEVKLGEARVTSVVGDLYTGTTGAFADPRVDANIGGGLLSRFVVAFDYGARRMYLTPGPAVNREDRYDRLGAWLMRDGDRIRVAALTDGGAAKAAGILVDDRIVAVDGTPVSKRPLAAWKRHFAETAAGTEVLLDVERGGQRVPVKTTLAELVP